MDVVTVFFWIMIAVAVDRKRKTVDFVQVI